MKTFELTDQQIEEITERFLAGESTEAIRRQFPDADEPVTDLLASLSDITKATKNLPKPSPKSLVKALNSTNLPEKPKFVWTNWLAPLGAVAVVAILAIVVVGHNDTKQLTLTTATPTPQLAAATSVDGIVSDVINSDNSESQTLDADSQQEAQAVSDDSASSLTATQSTPDFSF